MSAVNVPGFVIVSDDQSEDSTVHTAVTDKSGIQKLLTLSEVSSMQKELPTQSASKKPKKTVQKAEKIPCGLCNKSFISEKSLERHRKTFHSNEEESGLRKDSKPTNARDAQRAYISLGDHSVVASLTEELENLTSKIHAKRSKATRRKHPCLECGKTFVTPSMLKRHSVVHSGEKPYECLICGNKYSQAERLKRHMGTHTGQNLFTCKACGKTFVEKCRYIDHVRAHLEEKPFECDVCSKVFSNRVSLWKHKSIHTGDKKYYGTSCCAYRYKCEECGKDFRQKQDLVRHHRTHTGELPMKTLQCPVCSKWFSRKPLLETHLRTHTGERPFSCKYCLKNFACKRSFARHIKLHKLGGQSIISKSDAPPDSPENGDNLTGAGKSSCKQCNLVCTSEADLFQHVKDIHLAKSQASKNDGLSSETTQELPNSDAISTFSLLRAQLSKPPQTFEQTTARDEETAQSAQCLDSEAQDIFSDPEKLYVLVNLNNPDSISHVTQEELQAVSLALPHVTFCLPESEAPRVRRQEEGENSPQTCPSQAIVTGPASQTISATAYKSSNKDSTVSADSEISNECGLITSAVSMAGCGTPGKTKPASVLSLDLPEPGSDLDVDQTQSTNSVISESLVNAGANIVFKIVQQPLHNTSEDFQSPVSRTSEIPDTVTDQVEVNLDATTCGVSSNLTIVNVPGNQTVPNYENDSAFEENCSEVVIQNCSQLLYSATKLCRQTDEVHGVNESIIEFPDRASSFAPVELLREFMPRRKNRRRSV